MDSCTNKGDVGNTVMMDSNSTVLNMTSAKKAMKPALSVTRESDFPKWFQEVVKEADLAETSQVKGCMVLKPDGFALWEQVQQQFDPMLKSLGVKNAAFPLFIPLEYFQREAEHAEGFATEVAVVTHRRLVKDKESGLLTPSAPLEEPLVVRPTSEMIIGDSMSRWIQSHRDLPLKLNQWCSVVRMEMRPRIFLRTAEFWWHEGHSAHASAKEAHENTMEMFRLYQTFVTQNLAIPVVPGEKIASERFAGAERTFTLEAMMQDRKALQAATSHNLGQNFAKAMGVKFQNASGEQEFAHTTSWGMSTRIVGAMILVHADDDGLRIPPRIAPTQIIILPVIPKEESRAEVLAYAEKVKEGLRSQTYHGLPLRVEIDSRDIRGGDKNWQAIKKGVPIRIEVGPRDIADQKVVVSRRDQATGSKGFFTLKELFEGIVPTLEEQQSRYFQSADTFLKENIQTGFESIEAMKDFFSVAKGGGGAGFARVPWCGDESVLAELKSEGLTVRCIPFDQSDTVANCLFSGQPGQSEIIVAKAY